MRVINHLFRKKVKRDDDRPVYDPGMEDMELSAADDSGLKQDLADFLEDNHKEEVYSDISEFINGS